VPILKPLALILLGYLIARVFVHVLAGAGL
jgi:hypothetical protein